MSRDHPAANQTLKPVEASWCGSNEATGELKTSFFFTVREPPGSRSFVGRDKEGVSYPHWPLLRSTPPVTPCYGPCPVVLEVLECALELKSLVFRCAETAVTLPVVHAQFEVSQRSCANIVGAIDGSHVRIKVPSDSTDYFSRYQQHEFYFILS